MMSFIAVSAVLLALRTATALQPLTGGLMRRANDIRMGTIAVFGGTGQTGRECVYQVLLLCLMQLSNPKTVLQL